MTEQTFHITGLHPRSALCGRGGHIWAGPHWPSDDDMRNGRFVRCKDCDQLFAPALETATKSARNLEHAAPAAYSTDWRKGCGQPAGPGERTRTGAGGLVQECRELGRRVGTEVAKLVRDARSAGHHPPSSTFDGANATTAPTP